MLALLQLIFLQLLSLQPCFFHFCLYVWINITINKQDKGLPWSQTQSTYIRGQKFQVSYGINDVYTIKRQRKRWHLLYIIFFAWQHLRSSLKVAAPAPKAASTVATNVIIIIIECFFFFFFRFDCLLVQTNLTLLNFFEHINITAKKERNRRKEIPHVLSWFKQATVLCWQVNKKTICQTAGGTHEVNEIEFFPLNGLSWVLRSAGDKRFGVISTATWLALMQYKCMPRLISHNYWIVKGQLFLFFISFLWERIGPKFLHILMRDTAFDASTFLKETPHTLWFTL